MKQLKCEICGGTDLIKQDGLFVCQSCGCKYSSEEAKKMMIEGTVEVSGTVKIDKEDKEKEIQNILKLADDAFAGANYAQAYAYYSDVLKHDYQNAYATFQKGLSSAYQSSLADIRVKELANSVTNALKLKKAEQCGQKALSEFRIYMSRQVCEFCASLHHLSVAHYNKFNTLRSSAEEYWARTSLIITILKFAVNICDKKTIQTIAEAEELVETIANYGLTLCSEMQKELSYKDGIESKGNSAWDGSTIYGDRVVRIHANADSINESNKSADFFEEIIENLPSHVAARQQEEEEERQRQKQADHFFSSRRDTERQLREKLEKLVDHYYSSASTALKVIGWILVGGGGFVSLLGILIGGVMGGISVLLEMPFMVVSFIALGIGLVLMLVKALIYPEKSLSEQIEIYRNYLDYPDKYKQEIEQFEKDIAEQPMARKKSHKRIILSFSAVAAITVCAVVLNLVVIPAGHYKKGEELLAKGDYEAASDEFQMAGNYKDSAERIYEPYYVQGNSLLVQKEYGAAAEAFQKAGAYQDAPEKLVEVLSQIRAAIPRGVLAVGDHHTVGLRADGTVVTTGENRSGQCNVSEWSDIIAIAAGTDHTVGLKADGTVVATGMEKWGACNVSEWSDIVAITAYDFMTVGVKSDGTIVSTGDGEAVNLRTDNSIELDKTRYSEDTVQAIEKYSEQIVLKNNGTVKVHADVLGNDYDVYDWKNIISIVAGDNHVLGLQADGTLKVANTFEDRKGNVSYDHGQCEVSDWTNIITLAGSDYHTVGLKADGTIVAVGENDDGQCNVSNWTNIKVPEK